MRLKLELTVRAALVASVLALSTATTALAEYPDRPIQAIVPWGAGGGADGIVRKIMSIAERELPVSIFVENLDGGVTSVGINRLMNSPADGYTVGALTYDSVVTVPWEGMLPGYSLDKLDMIALVTTEPNAIIVGGKTDYASYDDLITAAKEAEGEINVGIMGLGSMTHLTLLQLQEATGTRFRIVAYPDGSPGQKEGILSGEVDAAVTSLGDFAPLLMSGDARGLVEFSASENPGFPDVPTSEEVGLNVQTGSFLLFAVPAGTPDEAKQVLEKAIETAWKSDEFQDWARKVGVTATWMGSDAVTGFAMDFQADIFKTLKELTDQGILE
ncbi:tripartite tricarboxylate transporter substrate binding protein [Paracoccus sp. TK19116]|uniref:Tripartite tricarboxylate transporter substrate binding protein n=1 Tax=Paracoccus albicereus TaxID=2922394 RepID=A0ABT1MRS4_9RHOB|nr:tripartite tricarboxylate transporter substrate binding protein [Paracoccus albicereus]MCQ0971003.1 tripartite tricarboxylate transporter substrate binding protein [Paracoccus albicereus]